MHQFKSGQFTITAPLHNPKFNSHPIINKAPSPHIKAQSHHSFPISQPMQYLTLFNEAKHQFHINNRQAKLDKIYKIKRLTTVIFNQMLEHYQLHCSKNIGDRKEMTLTLLLDTFHKVSEQLAKYLISQKVLPSEDFFNFGQTIRHLLIYAQGCETETKDLIATASFYLGVSKGERVDQWLNKNNANDISSNVSASELLYYFTSNESIQFHSVLRLAKYYLTKPESLLSNPVLKHLFSILPYETIIDESPTDSQASELCTLMLLTSSQTRDLLMNSGKLISKINSWLQSAEPRDFDSLNKMETACEYIHVLAQNDLARSIPFQTVHLLLSIKFAKNFKSNSQRLLMITFLEVLEIELAYTLIRFQDIKCSKWAELVIQALMVPHTPLVLKALEVIQQIILTLQGKGPSPSSPNFGHVQQLRKLNLQEYLQNIFDFPSQPIAKLATEISESLDHLLNSMKSA